MRGLLESLSFIDAVVVCLFPHPYWVLEMILLLSQDEDYRRVVANFGSKARFRGLVT